jgi:hypothetical protein
MLHRPVLLLFVLALAACADRPPLPEASGPLRALNAGRWTPGEADLREGAAIPATAVSAAPGAGR